MESEWIVESVEPVWWAVVGGVDVFLLFFVYSLKSWQKDTTPVMRKREEEKKVFVPRLLGGVDVVLLIFVDNHD